MRLAGRAGRIALVEAGGPRFEKHRQTQFFREDHIVDPRHPSTVLGRRMVLGGTTSVWGGRCIPLDREDFEGSPSSPRWPVSYEEVGSWIADALRFLQAGEEDFSTSVLSPTVKSAAVDDIADPDLKLNRIERFSEPTNVWKKWGKTLVESEHVIVLRGATCTNILTTPDAEHVLGVELRAESDRRLTLRATTVVIACGGLETPRLLLASRDHRPSGLGNEHDLVGRFYMTHLGGTIGSIRLRHTESGGCFDYAMTRDGVYARRLILLSPEARRRNDIRNIVFRPNVHSIVDPSHGDSILSAMAFAKSFVIPEYSRKLAFGTASQVSPATLVLRHGLNIATGLPRLARFGIDWLWRRTFAARKLPSVFLLRPDATYPMAFDAEQSPDPESRVALGATTDPYGVPRLAIRWRVNEADLASITRAYGILSQASDRAGLGQVELKPDFAERLPEVIGPGGGHHIGTARMGSDPRTSVVDENGELWSTKGLFVAGSAVFPTCGFANPTLTAVALAFRMAEHLVRRLTGRHPDPGGKC
ncbi:MAG: GMC family oxidoreductase [Bradyrhizobiaceae bacterium]|nr:GMC family oxidoreductase [Bradyrhizobiaceae bacterium]